MGRVRFPDAGPAVDHRRCRRLQRISVRASNWPAWRLRPVCASRCHYPPGTSKWNRIEHPLFSFITMTWPAGP